MLKRILSLLLLVSLSVPFAAKADEGMWLPMLIKRLNHTDMQKQGLQLTAEEIYSVNNSSLKDAIVQFGGFCTGEFISPEGLLLTNHHCGYGQIQSHSTPEHDYLTDGFWATSKDQELPNEGLFVDILHHMDDVTAKVLEGIDNNTPEEKRQQLVAQRMQALAKEASENGKYVTYVRDFFNGNEYYLFVYNRYNDVRLVGAPPSSIGKFGGDTDNWMWPRHTGDFSMFRVYMAPDGSPAAYSENNVPYKPKHYLPINIADKQPGDFSMVFGFPGRTKRFMTSHGLKLEVNQLNKSRIKLREQKLGIWKEDMDKDPANRIKYASKYASTANYYKYSIGQNEGIKRMRTIEGKIADEDKFQAWANAGDAQRKATYGNVLSDIADAYKNIEQYNLGTVYLNEAVLGTESLLMAYRMMPLYQTLNTNNPAAVQKAIEDLQPRLESFFKDYNPASDQKVFAALMKNYYEDIPKDQQPAYFKDLVKKYKGNFEKLADYVYNNSFIVSEQKTKEFLNNPTQKKLENDPAFQIVNSIIGNYRSNIAPKLAESNAKLERANRLYVAGLRLMNPDKVYYPDANSTLRLSYGAVKDYSPQDGVLYNYYTTLDGVMAKEDPNNEEFVVPAKLKQLYQAKDYGRYANSKGELVTDFITDNDITGGNSGSPVINGKGELIGLAFDGNWEAMTGDLVYDPAYKRTINMDTRYLLFLIDKFAGAQNLIDEMTIVDHNSPGAGDAAVANADPKTPQAELLDAAVTEAQQKLQDGNKEFKIKKEKGDVKVKLQVKD
ncbi:dipeptidyl-peptidase 7 [Pontibacter ummariensis]|uniref:Dipeptidyl-peptidase n=1 Tax=Pontibacter ummariensis TaxID=1610492 RepID=A0A239DZU6_9BACT|nr:S46 family peptidase [Pontibacter ummariensis]PRY13665.1 dipeptidyl-peptidase 7 [Pontibacter ummariensis]SNS37976.1 dipeptidyl-peptidase 7. Serine peptidase. MEROPS family S46 [Pontibacter ummariensis]